MTYQFTVSPDFSPEYLSGWYIFNTWLQRQLGDAIHLEVYNNFQKQRVAIQNDHVDLIYANPFDAAMLVREKKFLPLVRRTDMSDEVILAVNVDTAYHDVADLSSGIRVAVTEDPAVHMIGMIMLEAGDLGPHNTETLLCDTYVLVAKQLIQNKADVGVFLAKAYDDLSKIIKNQLRILVKSQISVVNHALMVGPKLMDKRSDLQALLMDMAHNEKGADVLKNLGIKGFVAVDHEEMEFMIDLMDTLAI